MNPIEEWQAETLGKAAIKALEKNGFKAAYAAGREEAAALVQAFLKPGCSVGFGGSKTIRDLDIQGRARALGCEILDHNQPGLEQAEKLRILRNQLTCDVFISSSNAVTLDGELVNVDGSGNRVAALTFGPAKTVVVVGYNKLVRDLDEALNRIELYASPLNNKRLDRPNPCVKSGYCMDCEAETRICRAYQILKRRPMLSDFTVIVVGEVLGF